MVLVGHMWSKACKVTTQLYTLHGYNAYWLIRSGAVSAEEI